MPCRRLGVHGYDTRRTQTPIGASSQGRAHEQAEEEKAKELLGTCALPMRSADVG